MKDQADMWVHESFANYAEGLYAECHDGKQADNEYMIGSRRKIRNDEPIVAPYGVNAEGSGDMYYKGGNMLHTMRQIVANDEKWRGVLRGIQSTFRHQTVTGAQIEAYINKTTGIDFRKVFAQYLTTTKIPVLEYKNDGGKLSYRWSNVVPGFAMVVRAGVGDSASYPLLHPTEAWKAFPTAVGASDSLQVNPNFFVIAKRAAAPTGH
jgi:aminopeptidase N